MKPLLNSAHGALKNLLQDAQLFQALLEVGRENLPAAIKPHLVGVGFGKQQLILQIDEAIWATQLRFYEPNLLALYQQHFPHLELCSVKVNVLIASPEPQKPKVTRVQPSEIDGKVMQEISSHVKSEGLKKALLSLSQRAKKNASDY